MNKTYELSYTAERIDEMLKEVDEHTIYSDATTEEHGLMSTTDKTKLDALPTAQQIEGALNDKVDKVEGKGLSTEDFTSELLQKLDSLKEVEANPTDEPTETLESIKIGDTVYTAPQGPQGEPGTDGQDGQDGQPGTPGPANTLTIGTVQEGEQAAASITGDAPNQELNLTLPRGQQGQQGEPGQNAYNPFKGTYRITDTLPTTGQAGDYIYVVDSQTPPVTHLYAWNGTVFADTLEVVTMGDSQFENSTKPISQTNVVNDLTTGGSTNVASAETVKELSGYINGTETVTYENQTVESGYFSSHDLTQSGFKMPTYRTNTSGTTKSCMLQVLEGQVYKICGTGGDNDYNLLYVITDAERHPIRYAEVAYNTRNNPIELTIEQGEAYLYCNLTSWQEGDYVEKKVVTENHDGLIEKVEEIEDDITGLESSVETLETVTQSNYTDINGIQPLVDTDLVAEEVLPSIGGHPARNDGSYSSSQYFKRYTVDLTGKYESGYRKVRFYGCQWSSSSSITSGLIATDIVSNVATVESYVPFYGQGSIFYFEAELELTPNSKYLIMTGVTQFGREQTTELANVPDLTSVTFFADGNSQGLKQRVSALEENPVLQSISVDLPDVINAVVGDTLQLYYKSIFRCVNPYIYDIKVTCNIGAQYPRYYELTPTSGQIGNHNITFTIKDNNNNLLGQKQVVIKVCQKVSNPTLNVLCVGASNTQEGQWPSELKKRLTTSNGSGVNPPIGFELSNINFVGRISKTHNGQQVNLEATGGYNFTTYITANAAFVRFFFTQAQVPSGINIGDKYSDGTTEYTISEINIPNNLNGYYGNINCSVSILPNSVGLNLTRVSGSGAPTITASASSQSGNPFVHDGVIDIAYYASQYCNNQIDIIYTELFGNGLTAQYQEDFTSTFEKMQSFIDMFRAVFPNCKFCLNVMQNKDEKGGLGVNYGAGTGAYAYPYGLKYGCHNLLTKLQKYINDNNIQDYVFIVNTLNEFDCENDYRKTVKAVNVRFGEIMIPISNAADMVDTSKIYLLKQLWLNPSSQGYSPGVYIYKENSWMQREYESNYAELFGENGAHPLDVGYYQMADAATRAFIAHFCQ